jgi:hypothetical protein
MSKMEIYIYTWKVTKMRHENLCIYLYERDSVLL